MPSVWPNRHIHKEEIPIRVDGAPRAAASFIQTWAYTRKVTQKICSMHQVKKSKSEKGALKKPNLCLLMLISDL